MGSSETAYRLQLDLLFALGTKCNGGNGATVSNGHRQEVNNVRIKMIGALYLLCYCFPAPPLGRCHLRSFRPSVANETIPCKRCLKYAELPVEQLPAVASTALVDVGAGNT